MSKQKSTKVPYKLLTSFKYKSIITIISKAYLIANTVQFPNFNIRTMWKILRPLFDTSNKNLIS